MIITTYGESPYDNMVLILITVWYITTLRYETPTY